MIKKEVYYVAKKAKTDLDNITEDIKELNIFKDLKLSLQLAKDDCDNLIEEYERSVL